MPVKSEGLRSDHDQGHAARSGQAAGAGFLLDLLRFSAGRYILGPGHSMQEEREPLLQSIREEVSVGRVK